MKKIIAIVIPLILIAVFGYTYYWYTKNPPRAKLSKEGEVCYEKCRNILRENFKKCGDGCYTGAPFFAYDKTTGKCLSNVDIEGTNYIDLHVNDCNSNTYLSRWNPTPDELSKLTSVESKKLEIITNNRKLLNALIDPSSSGVEGSLFGP